MKNTIHGKKSRMGKTLILLSLLVLTSLVCIVPVAADGEVWVDTTGLSGVIDTTVQVPVYVNAQGTYPLFALEITISESADADIVINQSQKGKFTIHESTGYRKAAAINLNYKGEQVLFYLDVTPRTGQDVTISFSVDKATEGSTTDNVYPTAKTYTATPGILQIYKEHTITATAGPNGTISPSGEITVAEGASKTFTITPDEGYKIADVTVDENSVGAVASYTFDTVEGDHSITASFEKIDYTVAVSPAQNGEVTADKPTAQIGEVVTITATPAAGYELDTITVTAEKGTPVTVIDGKFTMPADNVTVSAAFKEIDYAVKIAEGIVNGTVAASAESANVGDEITLTVTPETGYYLKTLTVVDDSQNSVSVTGNKFTMPAANVTVSAEFEKITYTVAVSQAQNGEVTTDKATAQIGDIVTITATPTAGYELDTITVTPDVGEAVAVTDGKFTMPAANVTVTVTFKEIDYTVNIDAGIVNGTVAASVKSANVGDEITLTITSETGYCLETLTVIDDSQNPVTVTENTFSMPASDVTVFAVFKKIDYTVSVSQAQNGEVTTDKATAQIGDTVTLTITPSEGFELAAITVTAEKGMPVPVIDGKFTMPADNVTVSAAFKEIDYAVKIDAGIVNGTVAASAESANVGDEITLTVTPETGYYLKTLTVVDDSQNSVSVTGNKFTMPAANVTVSAEFEKITYTVAVSQAQNGEVTTDKATAQIGDIVTITATPTAGYELDTITVTPDVGDAVAVTDGKFTMPAANVTVTVTFKKIDYAVNIDAGIVNGTVAASAESANVGDEITLTVTPETGYYLKTLTVVDDHQNPVSVPENKFTMPADNVTVRAEFEKITYTVDVASDILNGTVTVDKATAQIGDVVTVTAVPDIGYKLQEITVQTDGGIFLGVTDGKFTMTADNVTVSAVFEKIEYLITNTLETENGTVEITPVSGHYYGEEITVTVYPDPGYKVKSLTVTGEDGTPIDLVDDKFTMPAANVNIVTSFEKITYTVDVASGILNGTVTVDKETAQIGDTVIITATPSEGFELDTITVTPDVIEDSVTVTDGKFTMPADNVTVTATFKLKSYIVDITGVQNGTVTSTHETAKRGDTVTLTAEPHAGHIFNSFIITPDAGDKFEDVDGTFVMPAANISIALNVTKIKYNITALPAVNGTVTLSRDNATVNDIITVTAAPQSGYQLKSITVKQNLTGDTVTVTNGRFAMPADNVTVTVLFSVKPVAPPSGGGGGSSTPSTPQTPSTPAYETHVAIVGEDGVANFPSHEIIFRVTVPEDYEGKIEIIDRASVDTPDDMNVYHQADIILHDEIDEGEIVLIHFEIPLSVLEAKGLGPEDACLYHYDEVTGWTKLTTWYTVVGDTVIYDAEADAFSPFAIVFEENSAKLKGSEPVTPPTEDPTDEPETPFPVLGILAGLGAAVVLRRK